MCSTEGFSGFDISYQSNAQQHRRSNVSSQRTRNVQTHGILMSMVVIHSQGT